METTNQQNNKLMDDFYCKNFNEDAFSSNDEKCEEQCENCKIPETIDNLTHFTNLLNEVQNNHRVRLFDLLILAQDQLSNREFYTFSRMVILKAVDFGISQGEEQLSLKVQAILK